MIRSLLISTGKAMEEDERDGMEMTPIFVTAAVLMMLGAVYAGRLLCETTPCRLRRLRESTEDEFLPLG